MTPIAPHITAFLRERLLLQRGASAHTCASYAYSFQLLFEFPSRRFGRAPSELSLELLDASYDDGTFSRVRDQALAVSR